MKNIVIVSNVSGGLFSFRRELIQLLSEKNRVTILSSDTGRIQEFEEMGCKWINVNMDRHGKNPLSELKLISAYNKIIRKIKPDVVLTYTIKPNIYAGMVCASLKIPYIANITGLGTALENPGLIQKVTLTMYKFALRRAQKVFFQNQANQEFMIKHGVIKGEHDLLPGSGVNLSRYQVLTYPQYETVDFLFMARLMKEKGIDQYLDAAKFIRKKYPYTRFHICGRCEQAYEEKMKLLSEAEIVIYHGQVKDIIPVHSVSACTIHPTYYPEGMSNVLLESCAMGRPVITTNRPGCREIVDNGINGFVVQQKDSQDLIEKIEKFLALSWEERRAMGLAGRAKVEKQFDREIVIRKYLDEVEKVR